MRLQGLSPPTYATPVRGQIKPTCPMFRLFKSAFFRQTLHLRFHKQKLKIYFFFLGHYAASFLKAAV